jgi:hypothetical protein
MERSQTALPFAEAEGTHNERRNLLELALMRCRADLTLARLLLTVFSATAGGRAGQVYKRTLQELAGSDRWGLWCSPKTAQRAVCRARDLGLLVVEDKRGPAGEQRPNEYSIDWPGVLAALDLSRRPGSTPTPRAPARRSSADGQTDQGAGQIDQGAGQIDHHIEEVEISSKISLSPPSPSAPRGRDASAAGGEFDRAGRREARAIVTTDGRLELSTVAASGPSWSSVEAKLRQAGALNAAELVEHGRGLGRSPADLDRVAVVLAANVGRFSAPGGAAKFYLDAGRWPVEGVVDPIAQAERARQEAERRRAAGRLADERAQAAAAGQAEIEDLETRRGPELDGLGDLERDELAAAVIGQGGPLLRSYRAGAWRARRSVCRVMLLERLDAEPAGVLR